MKIKTWIKYFEGYVPPRCRKTRYEEKEEYVMATLNEAKLSDMKLAFEDKSYSGKGKIYAYKNKLWVKTKFTPDAYSKEDRYSNALEHLKWWNEHGSEFFVSSRYPYNEFAGRSVAMKEVRRFMSKYMLVDGELFEKTSEPMYCIYTFGLGFNHGGTHLAVDYFFKPTIDPSAYFNANQSEEAVAEAKETALARGDTNSVDTISANIVVHMPELVKINTKKHKPGKEAKVLKNLEKIVQASPDTLTAGLLVLGAAGGKE